MNIFVTGATGFLGKAFVHRLLARGPQDLHVYLLARSPVDPALTADKRVTVVHGQPTDLSSFAKPLLAADYVFHIGANASFVMKADYEAENFAPTKAMIDALKASQRLKAFVFTSTIGAVDRTPSDSCAGPLENESPFAARSPYGRSKVSCEKYIRNSGLPYTIVRPTWIYGSGMRASSHISQFVSMVAGGTMLAHVNFPGRVSLVHVNDLAACLTAMIGNAKWTGKTFFAASEAKSIGEIFAIIYEKLHGQRPSQVPIWGVRPFVRRLHAAMPLAAANLFVDYLYASETDFRTDVAHPIRFEDGINDVLKTHPKVNGAYAITGAGSGIGLALARDLDRRGKRLILIDRDVRALGEFSRHKILTADLTDRSAITDIAAKLEQEVLAGLINNAGVGYRRSTETIELKDFFTTVEVNIVAPVLLTKLVLRALKRDQAVIVNVGSSVAYNPLPNMSVYAASKAFLVSWSEALSFELRATNRVLTVSPSGTHTGFQKSAGVKVLKEGKGLASPDYVAGKITKAMLKGKKRVLILGAPSKVLLMVSKLLPREMNIKFWGILFGSMR